MPAPCRAGSTAIQYRSHVPFVSGVDPKQAYPATSPASSATTKR